MKIVHFGYDCILYVKLYFYIFLKNNIYFDLLKELQNVYTFL
jgi:hypothetical protein